MKKIGMVSAMLIEAENVLKWLGDNPIIDTYGDFLVYKYQKNGCEVYLIASGTGEIMATCATQILISVYKVDYIINFGLCGALYSCDLSERLVVESVVHYDYDISPIDSVKRGQYTRFSAPQVETDKSLLEIALKIDPSLKKVVCASGDKFICDDKFKKQLSEEFGAQICEMESAGILFASLANKVPALFIKVVSDTKDHAEEFSRFVERNNFGFIEILDKLLLSLA